MAIDTVEATCDLVRDLLADTDVPGGDLMTNAEQTLAFSSAWDELMSLMASDQVPTAKPIRYHKVAANTTILYPIQAGINDLDTLLILEERPMGTAVDISAVAAGTGNAIQVTTSTPHGLTGTPEVFVSDLLETDGIPGNGRWFATVVDTTNLLLRGSIFAGTYTAGGTVSVSSDRFIPVTRTEELSQRTPDTRLVEYCWREGAIQFVGATADVQVRITYLSDGTAPATGSLIYDGIKNALAHRTAAKLAYKHGRGKDDAIRLDKEARGEALDGGGGFFFTFLQKRVRDMQKTPLQRPVRPPDYLTEIYGPTA